LEGRDRGTLLQPYLLFGVDGFFKQTRPNPEEIATEVAPLRNQGYGVARIGAGSAFDLGGQKLRLDFAIKNLFGEEYVDWMSRYRAYAFAPGRNVTIRATVEF
jgi:outer membrane receptor protein involved in Fe transport